MRRFRGLLALLIAGPAPATLAVTGRMEATTVWAENINRASSPGDWRDAWRFEARGSASTLREWATGLLSTGEISAGAEHVRNYRKLDAASLGAAGSLRQKFGLGAFAPAISADASIAYHDTRLGFDDGWTATVAVRATKRLTRSWRAGLHGDWEERFSRSAIFDTNHHRFFATVSWDITDWLQLSHGNGRLWGSFTANASPGVWSRALAGALGTHISDYYNTVPWAATDAYGAGWVTYRIDGRVSFYWLELSPALGRNTSLPLRFENRVSVNKVGVKYRQDVWSLSLLHRF